MNILLFIKLYGALMAIGSLTVTGWYFCTRGQENTLPDGTVEKTGMIFKSWYFFWMQKKGKKKIFYKEHELSKLIAEISSNYPQYSFIPHLYAFETNAPFAVVNSIAEKWHIEALVKRAETYAFFKEIDQYKFPEFVRMPMVQCITCMASIYGSIFFWGAVSLIKEPLFTWCVIPWLAAVFFWVVFCFSLSVLNTALVRKFH